MTERDIDYKKLSDDRFKAWAPLFDRMKSDNGLINMEPFTLTDTNDKTIPHAISVTLNDISVFVDKVESSLGSADEQVTVESEDKGIDTDYIEDFVNQVFIDADNLLSVRGDVNLNPYIDQMNCRKGRCAVRCVLIWDGKKLVPELVPWDVEYVTYGMDVQGLAWICYKMERDRDSIEAEYPDFVLKGNDESYEVQDIWTRTKNEVYIGKDPALVQAHNFGVVPACVQLVPKGVVTKNDPKYQGESLLYLIRPLVPELNRLVSIMQSLNQKELDHALQLPVPAEDAGMKPKLHDELTNPGAVNVVPAEGGGYKPMPLGELKQQALWLHQIIETRLQRGGVSNFDMGTFNQPMSAVALVQVGEGRDQTFLPRLGTRGLLKKQIARQIIDRTLQEAKYQGKSSIQVGDYIYDISRLKGNYNIDFKYFIKSPVVDVARYQIGTAAKGMVSDHTIRREIIHLQDPDGEERLLNKEIAEQLSPRVKMYRVIKALLEEAEEGDEDAQLEAEIMAAEMGISLEQVLAGNLEPTPSEPQNNGTTANMMTLMDSAGRVQPEGINA